MSSFMGYHPANLNALRRWMDEAVVELGALADAGVSGDPAASAAMCALRRAQATVEEWCSFLRRFDLGLAFGYWARPAPAGDLRFATFSALIANGWRMTTDPTADRTGAAASVTTSDAAAVAHALATWDADELFDTEEELLWLDERLIVIASDPRLLAAFQAELAPTDERWRGVLLRLAEVRSERRPTSVRWSTACSPEPWQCTRTRLPRSRHRVAACRGSATSRSRRMQRLPGSRSPCGRGRA
jgi:hypothetical protein